MSYYMTAINCKYNQLLQWEGMYHSTVVLTGIEHSITSCFEVFIQHTAGSNWLIIEQEIQVFTSAQPPQKPHKVYVHKLECHSLHVLGHSSCYGHKPLGLCQVLYLDSTYILYRLF